MSGIPEGASVIIPRLFCHDVAAQLDFCAAVFGAVELNRRCGADGRVLHALLTIGPAMLMIESEWPDITNRAPAHDGSSPVALYLYVRDVDDVVRRAAARGARILAPAEDQFWGDRTAWLMDPSGHVWTVASRVEEPTEAERQERFARLLAEQASRGRGREGA
jgi:PhnB protein